MARNHCLLHLSGKVAHEKTPNLLKLISLVKIYIAKPTKCNFVAYVSNLTVKIPEDVLKFT